jgi:hypothetical protein
MAILASAFLLAIGNWLSAIAQPLPPPPVHLSSFILQPCTNVWYFAATAVATGGLESDYSNEISYATTNDVFTPTVAWDAVSPAPTIAEYRIYFGGASRSYDYMVSAGTNLSLTTQVPPPALTNRQVTVQALVSSSAAGPWVVATNLPPLVMTNPPPSLYRLLVTCTNF